jgi:hypothetical protein
MATAGGMRSVPDSTPIRTQASPMLLATDASQDRPHPGYIALRTLATPSRGVSASLRDVQVERNLIETRARDALGALEIRPPRVRSSAGHGSPSGSGLRTIESYALAVGARIEIRVRR